ncbi:MAG TPA: C25 family cysteine peptidase, partial [bacterium]
MTRQIIIILASLVAMSLAAGITISNPAQASTWIPLNGIQSQSESPNIQLLRSDFSEIRIKISIQGFFCESVSTSGGAFSRLSLDGEGYTTEIGRPELPVVRKLIEIPYGANPELVIGPMTARQGMLAEFGISERIIPVQPSIEKVPGAREAAQFVLDQTAYAQDAFAVQQFARLGEEGYLRGHHFVLLEIFPIDYNPAAGTLLVAGDIEITIRLTGSDMAVTRAMKARYADPRTSALAQRLFINHSSGGELDLIPPPIGLLIITSPHYAGLPILQEFVQWKEDKGFHATVATTQQTGTSNTQIKAYIQNAYDNWPIPPNFVLLIGDTDVIPHWTGQGSGSPGTDLYYATLEGADYFNDVGIGRLSPSNDGNLANMINKTLDYEQVGWTGNDEWEKSAVFMASNDNYTISEGTHNYVIANYLDPDGYRSTRLYCHTYGATTQQVTDNIN